MNFGMGAASTCSPASMSFRISGLTWAKFGKDFHEMSFINSECREYRCNERHALRKSVNKFCPYCLNFPSSFIKFCMRDVNKNLLSDCGFREVPAVNAIVLLDA
jgi:hypothetical protein